jgi:hypothetical protein
MSISLTLFSSSPLQIFIVIYQLCTDSIPQMPHAFHAFPKKCINKLNYTALLAKLNLFFIRKWQSIDCDISVKISFNRQACYNRQHNILVVQYECVTGPEGKKRQSV